MTVHELRCQCIQNAPHPEFIPDVDPRIIRKQGDPGSRIGCIDNRVAGGENSGIRCFMVIPQQQGTAEMINRKRFAILLPDQRIFIRLQPSDPASPLMGFLRAVFPEGRLHREIQIPLLQGGTLPDRKPIQTDPGISVAPQIAMQFRYLPIHAAVRIPVQRKSAAAQRHVAPDRDRSGDNNRFGRLYGSGVSRIHQHGHGKRIGIEPFIRVGNISGIRRRPGDGRCQAVQQMPPPCAIKEERAIFPDLRRRCQAFGNFHLSLQVSFPGSIPFVNQLIRQLFQQRADLPLFILRPVPVGAESHK